MMSGALLRQHLTPPATSMGDFVQYAVPIGDFTMLCLDTKKEGSHAGELCIERTDWLTTQLRAEPNRPKIVFAHHPPLALGLPVQDPDGLVDGGQLISMLSHFPQVKYLCCGHVHRPISGVIQGLAYSTLGSALFQAPPPRPAWNWDTFTPAPDAPQLGVLELAQGNVTLQFLDIPMAE